MSFSIDESIEELKEGLRAREAIAKIHPDATLRTICGQRVWVAERVEPTDFDFFILEDSVKGGLVLSIGLLGCEIIEGVRVYQNRSITLLYPWNVRTDAPKVHAALVELCKRGR